MDYLNQVAHSNATKKKGAEDPSSHLELVTSAASNAWPCAIRSGAMRLGARPAGREATAAGREREVDGATVWEGLPLDMLGRSAHDAK